MTTGSLAVSRQILHSNILPVSLLPSAYSFAGFSSFYYVVLLLNYSFSFIYGAYPVPDILADGLSEFADAWAPSFRSIVGKVFFLKMSMLLWPRGFSALLPLSKSTLLGCWLCYYTVGALCV